MKNKIQQNLKVVKVTPNNNNPLFNKIMLAIQIIIAAVALVVGIISTIKDGSLLLYLEILVAIDFFIMAFNSYKILNRKKLALIWLILAIILTIMSILTIVG